MIQVSCAHSVCGKKRGRKKKKKKKTAKKSRA
jgi:hypothetical protein